MNVGSSYNASGYVEMRCNSWISDCRTGADSIQTCIVPFYECYQGQDNETCKCLLTESLSSLPQGVDAFRASRTPGVRLLLPYPEPAKSIREMM